MKKVRKSVHGIIENQLEALNIETLQNRGDKIRTKADKERAVVIVDISDYSNKYQATT